MSKKSYLIIVSLFLTSVGLTLYFKLNSFDVWRDNLMIIASFMIILLFGAIVNNLKNHKQNFWSIPTILGCLIYLYLPNSNQLNNNPKYTYNAIVLIVLIMLIFGMFRQYKQYAKRAN